MPLTLRQWATPLVAGSFVLMAVTGTTMFFHVNSLLAKGLHEWAGWALLAGGVAHLVMNWRAFTTYLKRPVALGIMGLGMVVTAATLLPVGGGAAGAGPQAILASVASAPVPVLAQLSGQSAGDVVADLVAAGFAAANETSTITGLAGDDFGRQMGAMEAVFSAD